MLAHVAEQRRAAEHHCRRRRWRGAAGEVKRAAEKSDHPGEDGEPSTDGDHMIISRDHLTFLFCAAGCRNINSDPGTVRTVRVSGPEAGPHEQRNNQG